MLIAKDYAPIPREWFGNARSGICLALEERLPRLIDGWKPVCHEQPSVVGVGGTKETPKYYSETLAHAWELLQREDEKIARSERSNQLQVMEQYYGENLCFDHQWYLHGSIPFTPRDSLAAVFSALLTYQWTEEYLVFGCAVDSKVYQFSIGVAGDGPGELDYLSIDISNNVTFPDPLLRKLGLHCLDDVKNTRTNRPSYKKYLLGQQPRAPPEYTFISRALEHIADQGLVCDEELPRDAMDDFCSWFHYKTDQLGLEPQLLIR